MSAEARALAAEQVLADARNTLARIELAASQITREACTPAGRTLAHGISDAVGQLDRLLSRALEPLAYDAEAPRAVDDAREVLSELGDRLARSLAARGVRLEVAPCADAIPGDPELLRRAALVLLRAGAHAVGPQGQLVLGLRSAPLRAGVRIALREPSGAASASEAWMEEPAAFALRHGGFLERSAALAGSEATLWLPRGTLPCAAP